MLSNETDVVHMNEYSLFERIFFSIILSSICIIGVLGNILVLTVAVRKQSYKLVTNCYIINLSITDLLFLLISGPLTIYLGLTNTWIFSGLVDCQIHIYIAHVLLQTTCYTLAAMSIDRYLFVKTAHPRPQWRTPTNALILCIIIWIVSIIFVLPYTSLLLSREMKKKASMDCSLSSPYSLFASCFFPFSAFYIFPLLIIVICYTRLVLYMRHVSKSIRCYRNHLLKRRQITRTLVALTCAFAICWLPIHLLELLNCKQMLDRFYVEHSRLLDLIRVTAHALSYFNSCLNPLLYAFYNREFFP